MLITIEWLRLTGNFNSHLKVSSTSFRLKLKSVSKYNHFMGRYNDTNVEKSGILLLKIEQDGGSLEI
jgi:hypothetical protein